MFVLTIDHVSSLLILLIEGLLCMLQFFLCKPLDLTRSIRNAVRRLRASTRN